MVFTQPDRKIIYLIGIFAMICLDPSFVYAKISVSPKNNHEPLGAAIPATAELTPPTPSMPSVITVSAAPAIPAPEAPLDQKPPPVPQLSRFRVFAEFGPGIGIVAIPVFFPFVGFSFSPVDTYHRQPSSFCFQLLLSAKFGAGYAPEADSWLINPMFDASGVFLFGQKKWWGLTANVGIGYGYSTTGYGNLHSVRLDLGLGALINVQPHVSRFAIYVRVNVDPINFLLTFPVGGIFRF